MDTKVYKLHPRQMFLPLIITTLLTFCSISCLVMAFQDPSRWTYWLLGIAGTLFFGSLTLKGAKQVGAKKALITLDEEGLLDCTLYNTPYRVAYGDIQNVRSYTYRRKHFVGVNLYPEAEEAFLARQDERMQEAFRSNKEISRFLINLPIEYIYDPKKEHELTLRQRAGLTYDT